MRGLITKTYSIIPVAKPRMTRRDKWLAPPRPSVAKYWAFKDQVREANIILPQSGTHVIFYIPMPKSWSKKKKSRFNGKPHQNTPDWDNLGKALSDAIYDQDCTIWDIRISKRWADKGFIEIITDEDFK